MYVKNLLGAIALIVGMMLTETASAQTSEDWRMELAPYGWLAGVDSDIDIGPIESESDASFGDIVDVLQGALMLHLEVGKGRAGLFTDILYMNLEDDADKGPLEIDLELQMAIWEVGGFYRFGGDDRSFDVLGGARAFFTDIELDLTPGLDRDRDEDWVDPFIGGRLQGGFTEKWGYSLRADVGGFGAGSEISMNATGLLSYDLTRRSTLLFGYRYLYFERDEGSLDLEASIHGPITGVNITL